MKRILRASVLTALLAAFTVGWRAPAPTGLIYPINMTLADDRLYVSDRHTGVHVFDVANPEAPEAAFTIELSGNRGTAVRGNIVYANDYRRLLVIRVEGDTYEVVKEIESTYEHEHPPVMMDTVDRGYGCSCPLGAQDDFATAPQPSGGSGGTGSSFATFAVIDDYLYYLDYTDIVTMDISTPEDPQELSRRRIGWDIETLFPTDALLFVGGARGMYIFDRSEPASPKEIGRVEHFRACDPVVVSGPVAYVTLRGESVCGGGRNVLLCVSIQNPSNPTIIGEKVLPSPYGLTVKDPFLYVSAGEDGFQLLDISKPTDPKVLAGWADWPTKDFIWSGRFLYVLGFDDLRIFDVSEPGKPELLATIEPGNT